MLAAGSTAPGIEIEPLLRSSATIEIDTRKLLAEVMDQPAALAGPPPSRRWPFRSRYAAVVPVGLC